MSSKLHKETMTDSGSTLPQTLHSWAIELKALCYMKWVLLPHFFTGQGRVLELSPSGFKSQLCQFPTVWCDFDQTT